MKFSKQIKIPYAPRKAFQAFHDSKMRWSVLCCHRRAGKTLAAVNHLIRDALSELKTTFAYIGPTYTQAKRVAWQYFKDFSIVVPGTSFNEAELRVDYPNGSRIYVLGAENPASLRGLALNGVVFDEYSQQPPHIFGEVIRPALADRQGYAVWIGTVVGKNHLWTLWNDNKEDPEWFTMYLKASESGILPAEELADARKTMSDSEYLQEFELDVNATIKGAYYTAEIERARRENRVTAVPYDKFSQVSVYFDLGIGDDTAMVFVQRIGVEWHVLDAYKASGEALHHYVDVLNRKGYAYERLYLPHDAAARELGTGKSREELLRSLTNTPVLVLPRESVEDGINAVRMIFSQCWFDSEKCAGLIDALSLYRKEWDEKAGMFKEKPKHDWTSHYADAFRYFAMHARTNRRILVPESKDPEVRSHFRDAQGRRALVGRL